MSPPPAQRAANRDFGLLLALALSARLPRLGLAAGWLEAFSWLLAELACCGFIYAMMERLSRPQPGPRAFRCGLGYALNPLPLLLGPSALEASAALALALAAAWFLDFSQHPLSDAFSALCLGAALAFGWWPLLLLPIFLAGLDGARGKLAYAGFFALMPLLSWWGVDGRAFLVPGELGLAAAVKAVFYGAGAPEESARAVLEWTGLALLGLLGLLWLGKMLFQGRTPLLAGSALACCAWAAFDPGSRAAAWLPLLGFALLLPGGLAARVSAAGLAAAASLCALFSPEMLSRPPLWEAPELPRPFFLAWGAFLLGLWFFLLMEASGLLALCRNPRGRLEYR